MFQVMLHIIHSPSSNRGEKPFHSNKLEEMAVTHADLALHQKIGRDLRSKNGAVVIVLSILLGLCCFILCLFAEATRTEVTWMANGAGGSSNTYECVYNGSGSRPLWCAAIAFLGLAVAIVAAHICLMVMVNKSPPPALMYYDPDSGPSKKLTLQAGLFFVSTWVSFAVAEVLLIVGLAVESAHLKNWSTPQQSCITLRKGIFSAAGVFSLVTVFLIAGLHITALRAQMLMHEEERVRREMEAANASIRTERVETMVTENRNVRTLSDYLTVFSKECDMV